VPPYILARLDRDGHAELAAKVLETSGFSRQRLGQARAVLAYSRELALAVRDGLKTLDEALAEVKAARDAINSDEGMIARLRKEAPDLANLVTEERMKPREAVAALEERVADLDRSTARTAACLKAAGDAAGAAISGRYLQLERVDPHDLAGGEQTGAELNYSATVLGADVACEGLGAVGRKEAACAGPAALDGLRFEYLVEHELTINRRPF
jgi:hypothetical protein